MEWYLNSTYFGRLAYGAEQAARLYLGKPVSQLNLAECALLAAVAQAPSLNPLDAPEAALTRQKQVLDQMLSKPHDLSGPGRPGAPGAPGVQPGATLSC